MLRVSDDGGIWAIMGAAHGASVSILTQTDRGRTGEPWVKRDDRVWEHIEG